MKKMLKSKKGFTLVELMVVIVIIGILAAVSVPMYSTYMKKAKASEGQALAGAIAAAQRVYYAEYNSFLNTSVGLGIDVTGNKYFTTINSITGNSTGYGATVRGNADVGTSVYVTVSGGTGSAPVITVNGL